MNTFQVDGKSMDLSDLSMVFDDPMVQGQLQTVEETVKMGVRNIHTWKFQFDEQMKTYKKDYEGMKCTARGELDKQLQVIEKQIERVRGSRFF